jgi:hypothetical protein
MSDLVNIPNLGDGYRVIRRSAMVVGNQLNIIFCIAPAKFFDLLSDLLARLQNLGGHLLGIISAGKIAVLVREYMPFQLPRAERVKPGWKNIGIKRNGLLAGGITDIRIPGRIITPCDRQQNVRG